MMDQSTQNITVHEICSVVGRKNIATRVGVGLTQVSNAAVSGIFPAKWYLQVKEICAEHDLSCPVDLFNFVAHSAPDSTEHPKPQGDAA